VGSASSKRFHPADGAFAGRRCGASWGRHPPTFKTPRSARPKPGPAPPGATVGKCPTRVLAEAGLWRTLATSACRRRALCFLRQDGPTRAQAWQNQGGPGNEAWRLRGGEVRCIAGNISFPPSLLNTGEKKKKKTGGPGGCGPLNIPQQKKKHEGNSFAPRTKAYYGGQRRTGRPPSTRGRRIFPLWTLVARR